MAGTDMPVCGQAHMPYHYRIAATESGTAPVRHLLCPGPVGKPQDGNWRASYVLVSFDPQKDLHADADALRVDFYRVPYDLHKAVKAIKNSQLSTWYSSCLITG